MESKAVLKKLLLVAFLSVLSTGIPAYAVDYIACREMLRTKNEFIDISSQYETGKIKTQAIYSTKQDIKQVINDSDKCYLLYSGKVISKPLKDWKYDDESNPGTISFPLSDCIHRVFEKGAIRRNPKDTKSKGLYFLTDEGHYYYKKALKVEADMRKANCPY